MNEKFNKFVNYLQENGYLKRQGELADALGISAHFIADIKGGRRPVSKKTNQALVRLYPFLNPEYFLIDSCDEMLRRPVSVQVTGDNNNTAGHDLNVGSPEIAKILEDSRKIIEAQAKQITDLASVLKSQSELLSRFLKSDK